MGTRKVIGIRSWGAVVRLVMAMIVGTSQRRMLDIMQRAQLVEHRPDHHSQHQQHQKTGAHG
ncbi:MAG: hypothetical protein BGP25_00645 [Lysobacterales bacterium 63-13]|nr:MAG: hypothetical protein BGP25_00645 [Xanthomonadales bacterium 63-13]